MTMQSITVNGKARTIATVNDNPPIPTRGFDWCAWIDGREEWQSARGASEQEAIENLIEKIEEDEEEACAA